MTDDKTVLRRQDFWTALLLLAGSLFFLWKTTEIPFFKADAAGVEAGRWYNSAALVPYGIFTGIFALGAALLVIAIRQGGAPKTISIEPLLESIGSFAGRRMAAASLIMLAYIFCLVPRVDFTIASALVLAALIYGFHETRWRATAIAITAVLMPAGYSLLANFPQSRWNAPHDDDWLTLAAFIALSIVMQFEVKAATGGTERYIRLTPVIAFVVPLFLVVVMAFGFRQNIPNRTGLLFQQVEYHYFVTLKPWLVRMGK